MKPEDVKARIFVGILLAWLLLWLLLAEDESGYRECETNTGTIYGACE